ncbi:hypothetical protein Zmor_022965 [Zophobas morio]|uniref:Cytochrome P450 n=1 Tax=Zophobas morio TaxID=2755281 RepID=A0AA38I233_9CUCU|nr:hypothetical protein Zmor_022965 [Zophobas morio]
MLWLLALIIFATFAYWKLKSSPKTEKILKQIVHGSCIGSIWKTVTGKKSFADMIQDAYYMEPNTRYSTFYQFFNPVLLVKDPDLIKQMLVKDSDHFMNHQHFIPPEGDPIFYKNLFSMENQEWRDMRSRLTPVFTSSKMKYMFSLITQNCDKFVKHFLRKEETVVTVEMREIMARFSNDVISNIVFGVEVDAVNNPNDEVYLNGKNLTNLTGLTRVLKFLGSFLVPKLYKILKISPFPEASIKFFSSLVQTNIDVRQKNNIVRPDMINILLDARKNAFQPEEAAPDTGFAVMRDSENFKLSKTKIDITDLEIAAQVITFFFAGFETVSGMLSFIAYELGANPEVQQRLIGEVDHTLEACGGQITYEAILSMKYMDMVVTEALRKWPVIILTDRMCTKPYTIEAKYPDEKSRHVKEGSSVWLPVFAIHRDPENYPEPDKFDPERFSDENKRTVKPYTYFPFGVGPRGCLASRLGLLEAKTLFFYILTNFEIVPVEKTQIPLKISKKRITMNAEGGFWFGLKRRTELSTPSA